MPVNISRRGVRYWVEQVNDGPPTWTSRGGSPLRPGAALERVAITWQHKPIPEVGHVGVQPEEVLELVAERLRQLNAEVPSRETSLAITSIEQACLWLEERRQDRVRRGVEGTKAP